MEEKVVIIGGGPAGLATAFHLQKWRVPFTILEKGVVGASWRDFPKHLRMNSIKDVSALPGLAMPAGYPRFPFPDQFADYLERYAHRFDFPIETGVEIIDADYKMRKWQLQTNKGEIKTDKLVVATGIWNTPHIPTFEGQDSFRGRILHSSQYTHPKGFASERVLVVGANNSAAEIACDLARHGVQVGLAIRNGINLVRQVTSPWCVRLGTWALRNMPRGLADRCLRQMVETKYTDFGLVPSSISPLDKGFVLGLDLVGAFLTHRVVCYPKLKKLYKSTAYFADGREAGFDSIILATGFRPTLHFVPNNSLAVGERGLPKLNGWCSTLNSNLYVVGFWRFSGVRQGWLQAIGRLAGEAAYQIARDLR
jgi:cation diffusion facilitator CzcD-associated flavoprotein CzcO